MIEELKGCPFCGEPPGWVRHNGNWGYTPSAISLGCVNLKCDLRPTTTRITEGWEQGRGHFDVDPRADMAAAWNRRA